MPNPSQTSLDVPGRGPLADGALCLSPWFWAKPEAESPKSQPERFIDRFMRSGVNRVYGVDEDETTRRREIVCALDFPL